MLRYVPFVIPLLSAGAALATVAPGLAAVPAQIGPAQIGPAQIGPAHLGPASPVAPAVTARARQLSSDGDGYCALTSAGLVKCWGYAFYGELGDTSLYFQGQNYSDRPVTVPGLPAGLMVVGSSGEQLEANTYCTLLANTRVACWGSGGLGQLGDGHYASSLSPVAVASLSGATQLVTDDAGYCAVVSGGDVRCWGDNSSDVPVRVGGASGVRSLGSDGDGYCAILHSRRLACWAPNGRRGSPQTAHLVSHLANVQAIVGETGGTRPGYCAVVTGSVARCWGYGADGELGNGTAPSTPTGAPVPVPVKGLSGVRSLASDGAGFCAVVRAGHVACWGWGTDGKLGDGASANADVPVTVKDLSGVRAMASDGDGYCASVASGGVWCWGAGSKGQLGDGRDAGSNVPVPVHGLASVTAIVSTGTNVDGAFGYCALTATGSVSCWGTNAEGDLGDGNTRPSPVPVAVAGL